MATLIKNIAPKYFLGIMNKNPKVLGSKIQEIIDVVNGLSTGTEGNPVVLPAGSVSLPSLTFIGNLHSGLYWIGLDHLGVSVGDGTGLNPAKVLDISTTGLGVTGSISSTTTVTATTGAIANIITPVTSGGGTSITAPVKIVSGSTLTSATTPAITAATSGAIYTLAAAAITVTLPACSAANIGLKYKFVTTTAATAQIINTTGTDVFLGSIFSHLAIINATNDTANGASTANKTITMNGTTTGGLPGSVIEVVCISATQWLVTGRVIGASGTQATLFSN